MRPPVSAGGIPKSLPATCGPTPCAPTIRRPGATRTSRLATRRKFSPSHWMASPPRSWAPDARTAASTSSGPTTANSSATRRFTPARQRIRPQNTTRACWHCPAPSVDCNPAARPTDAPSSRMASTPCALARKKARCRPDKYRPAAGSRPLRSTFPRNAGGTSDRRFPRWAAHPANPCIAMSATLSDRASPSEMAWLISPPLVAENWSSSMRRPARC